MCLEMKEKKSDRFAIVSFLNMACKIFSHFLKEESSDFLVCFPVQQVLFKKGLLYLSERALL